VILRVLSGSRFPLIYPATEFNDSMQCQKDAIHEKAAPGSGPRFSKEAIGRKLRVAEERSPAERAARVEESRTVEEQEDQTHARPLFLTS